MNASLEKKSCNIVGFVIQMFAFSCGKKKKIFYGEIEKYI